ncbi:periplasmic beta-glucosidase-like [Liolophura sinensis]|uniref:periplasmic beta-glucosidase-like n=1 Tax=Liolophura sinensis TaxID=3198878 RepID=UPI0031582903
MTGRTYRYPSQAENLYPFGYGLSYSTFLYSNLTVPANVEAGGYINGQVMVKNTGRFDADEVVQIYVSWQNPTVPTPALQLVSFGRLTVPQGEQLLYEFTVAADQIGVWHDDRGWVVENGQINVFAGGQQPNQARNVGSNVLVAEVQIITTTNLGKF